MTQTYNPLNALVHDGQSLQRTLNEDAMNLSMAIEQRQYALQAFKSADQNYKDAESEFLSVYTYTDEDYLKARNAEAREILRDRALVDARNGGELGQPWRVFNECRLGLDNAQMTFDQCEVKFKASRVAAELLAGMLRAASI